MVLAALPLLALLAGGCLWPIDYQAEMDASPDYPPVIVGSNPRMPGELTGDPLVPVPSSVSKSNPVPFEITVEDRDIGDTLTVRIFRNYVEGAANNVPADEVVVANDPVTGTTTRPPISIESGWWCNLLGSGTQILIDVVVADRPFTSDPRSAEIVGTDGAKTKGSWIVVCQD